MTHGMRTNVSMLSRGEKNSFFCPIHQVDRRKNGTKLPRSHELRNEVVAELMAEEGEASRPEQDGALK